MQFYKEYQLKNSKGILLMEKNIDEIMNAWDYNMFEKYCFHGILQCAILLEVLCFGNVGCIMIRNTCEKNINYSY